MSLYNTLPVAVKANDSQSYKTTDRRIGRPVSYFRRDPKIFKLKRTCGGIQNDLSTPNNVHPVFGPFKPLYIFLISPIHATYPAHHILLDFITLVHHQAPRYTIFSSHLLPRPSQALIFSAPCTQTPYVISFI